MMEILHLSNREIDRTRWDETVTASPGANLYTRSWYLDAVHPGWEALVTPGYEHVMPLTARKKMGIGYLCQPLLSQQHGVFSTGGEVPVTAFLEALPDRCRLIEITLNENNTVPDQEPFSFHTTLRIDLSHPYAGLAAGYNDNTRRNLKKADASLTFETGIPAGQFLDLLRRDDSEGSRILLKKENRKPLLRLIHALQHHHAGDICGVTDGTGTLLSAALFAQAGSLHYYLAPAATAEGREARATFLLVDRYIHHHSGSPAWLDFEGSDIPSVARFYQGFGAQPVRYPSVRINRLPWPLKNWADRRIR